MKALCLVVILALFALGCQSSDNEQTEPLRKQHYKQLAEVTK